MQKKIISNNNTPGLLLKTGRCLHLFYHGTLSLIKILRNPIKISPRYQKAGNILPTYRLWRFYIISRDINNTQTEALPELLSKISKKMFYNAEVISAVSKHINSIKPSYFGFKVYTESYGKYLTYIKQKEQGYNKAHIELLLAIMAEIPEDLHMPLIWKVNAELKGVLGRSNLYSFN
ncbi:hypothetical protein ACFL57_00990 [Candidatus Margulisiibacteriota bacterium]